MAECLANLQFKDSSFANLLGRHPEIRVGSETVIASRGMPNDFAISLPKGWLESGSMRTTSLLRKVQHSPM
jgi:hypothetical protein